MLSLTRELTIWRSVDLSKGKLVALSPAEIQTGISIARTVASYTPASVVVCPVLDFTGMALGNYAEAQAEAAQNQWQSSVMTHLTTVQSSVGAIQGSMAVIGLGSVAGVALSAVNLYHMMKLRQDVKQLKLEVKSGFIDLKQALKDQGAEIIQRIDQVAKDVKFQHHQTILVQAYGLFMQAINCLRGAVKLQDVNRRNAQIDLAKGMLFHSLANYGNPQLDAVPPEQVLYENLKHKSHYLSLRDQLKFMVKPDSRRGHESYITQQATASSLKALAPSNWQAIPDLTVANLYWYFKNKEAQG